MLPAGHVCKCVVVAKGENESSGGQTVMQLPGHLARFGPRSRLTLLEAQPVADLTAMARRTCAADDHSPRVPKCQISAARPL
jgi:hypothetical protein